MRPDEIIQVVYFVGAAVIGLLLVLAVMFVRGLHLLEEIASHGRMPPARDEPPEPDEDDWWRSRNDS